MSFYRTFITAVAAMGLATSVFAADETTTTTTQPADMNATTAATTTETTSTTTSATTEQTQTKVNINTATAKELAKVDGLNKSKAAAIVSYRKKHGEFKSLDDLKEVKGFKKMNEDDMKKLQDRLTIS
ncbi:MAG: ComEA family DNA-binding protein [Gammaproteobacteria bacterium]